MSGVDVGVDDRRAPPLELAVLGQHFVTTRDTSQPARAQPRGDALLVRGIDVGVQQAHGDDVGAARLRARRPAVDARLASSGVEHRGPSASSRSATPNVSAGRRSAAAAARRCCRARAASAGRSQDVLEAARRDQRDARALALEHRVGRDRRSVHDVGRRRRGSAVCDAGENRARRIVGRGAQLVTYETAVRRGGRNQ